LGGNMIPGNGIAGNTFSGITSQQRSVGVFRDGNILVGGLIDGQVGSPGKVGFVNVEGGARPVLAVVLGTTADSAAAGNHTHDSRYYLKSEIDSLLAGKAAVSHTHTISQVTGLQTALDGKANLSGATFTGLVEMP